MSGMKITVVVPAYNEAANVPLLHARLSGVAESLPQYAFEFVFVDDGSSDATPDVIAALQKLDSRIRGLCFARNFGSHAACLAGLGAGSGDYYVIIAADLQDPPEIIRDLLVKAEDGADVVFAAREGRNDPWLTVKLANIYHGLMRRYAIPNWPNEGADVVLLNRQVRDVLTGWRQKNTSLFAQILWSGFRQSRITYEKQARKFGESHWTFKKRLKLFADSFVSFSFAPIRMISYAGIAMSALGFVYATFVILNKLFFGAPLAGWTSLMAVVLFVSGFQLLTLGIIGEYLWRVADEVRGTPAYLVRHRVGFESDGMRDEVSSYKTPLTQHESTVR